MKKAVRILLLVLLVVVLAFLGLNYYTKSLSPLVKVEAAKGPLKVAINYCSPAMKGRKVFGALVPYGTVWRTGANEATLIAFNKTATLASRKLKADTYSLWTIPDPKYWTIILNSETGQWGTNYDETKDYLRVKVPAQTLTQPVEKLKIDLLEAANGLDMVLQWENTRVVVPIK